MNQSCSQQGRKFKRKKKRKKERENAVAREEIREQGEKLYP